VKADIDKAIFRPGAATALAPVVACALLAACVLLAACGAAESPRADADAQAAAFAAMDSVYERFARAYRLGEPDSVLALYADDPLYLPGQGDIRRGRETLRGQFDFLERIREADASAHIGFETVARRASGELAFDVGSYTLEVEQADGSGGPLNRGKFATVWERSEERAWRIRVDSFSPAPPAAE
jgi:uncharacterized protein (TIGR02246 family)